MKKFLMLIPFVALGLSAVVLPMREVAVSAEETSDVSVVESESTQEETVSSSEPFDYESIVIDGKTIAQWKKELADSQTRTAAIFTLASFAIITLLGILKWLSDRGLLKKTKLISDENEKNMKELRDELENRKAELNELVEKANSLNVKATENFEKMKKSSETTNELLLRIAQDDPKLVAAGTFRKMKEIIGDKENAKEE